MNASSEPWLAGIARRIIAPPPGVELAGLGFYLNRTWERVRDDLTATALVIGDRSSGSVAILALDLMYNDAAFTQAIRQYVVASTNLRPDAICVNVSHSHNAPTAGFIRGAGERHPEYLRFAARQAADAVIEAWQKRQPARLSVGSGELSGMTFNRARDNGPIDSRVGVLRVDALDGRPLAVAVNFHAHPIAHMEVDLRAVSRDWPGEVVDQIESALPGAMAMYLQGTCGDVNFKREFNGTDRRFEPARVLTSTVLNALNGLRSVEPTGVNAVTQKVSLPTRLWTRDEVSRDREEGEHRQKTGDITGWLDGIAKVIVNQPNRLPLRYAGSVEEAVAAVSRFAVEWTEEAGPDLHTRPEILEAEVQAIRIGDLWFAANPSELFTTLGLEVRRRWPHDDLFMLGYSNGSIGYLPDAFEIQRGGYAAVTSPKFTGQFPFTFESGGALVDGLLRTLQATRTSLTSSAP
jgi:hypothetical protein